MRKIFLVLILISCFASLAYAGIESIGGYAWTPITKTYSTEGTASGMVVWRPASGNKIVLMGAMIWSKNGVPSNTTIELETGWVASGPTGGNGTDIIPPMNITSGPVVIGTGCPIWKGDADATLTITTNNSFTPAITLWGYETSN